MFRNLMIVMSEKIQVDLEAKNVPLKEFEEFESLFLRTIFKHIVPRYERSLLLNLGLRLCLCILKLESVDRVYRQRKACVLLVTDPIDCSK